MPSLNKIKQVTLIALQAYPDIYARYISGDSTVTAPMSAIQHMLAEIGRDVEVSEIEPFIKSREATILADASNKGILPLGTPCQHYITLTNRGTQRLTILSGRVFEDAQGRPWQFLQNAEVLPNESVDVLAEQSQVRKVKKTIIETLPFNQFKLDIEEDMSLVSLTAVDQDSNIYNFVTRWMNTKAGDYAIILKTDTLREITLEFGDTARFGRTLEANTELEITVLETYGEVDASTLKEAMLQQANTADEAKLAIRFKAGGVVRMGANPLSIDQMRLLASYPTHDDNAVFLGNFEALVRKKFMNRTFYLNVWNEMIHEQHYGSSVNHINHLFVAVVPKNPSEYDLICSEIEQLIAIADNLYSHGNVVFIEPQERPFNITVNAKLAPVHAVDVVKEQIRTLLVSNYGKEQLASSYNMIDGFNLQEISELFKKNIPAFQDRQSDFKIDIEDLSGNGIKPNHWIFMTADSISFNIERSGGLGGGTWTVL